MGLRTKLVLAFVPVSLAGLLATSAVAYLSAEVRIADSVMNHLESVAVIQENRVDLILRFNIERIDAVASRTQLRLSLENYTLDRNSSHQDRMNRILDDFVASNPNFLAASVIALDGVVAASTNRSLIGGDVSGSEFFPAGAQSKRPDIVYARPGGKIGFHLTGPLLLDQKLLGAVVIDTGAEDLVGMVDDYAGLGETGETVIARRSPSGDAQFIAPTRFDRAAAFLQTVPSTSGEMPITSALAGREVFLRNALDYRGVPVVAVTRYVEGADWGIVVKQEEAEAFGPLAALRLSLTAASLVAAVTVVATSVLVARAISRPVAALGGAARMMARGKYSVRSRVRSGDEIGDLALAFNSMAATIQGRTARLLRSQESLRALNLDLERRVAARTAELEEANRELEAFSYSISHDLRAPLRAIQSFGKILQEEQASRLDSEGSRHLGLVVRSSERMSTLIDDLLLFSRTSRQALAKQRVDPREIAESVVAELVPPRGERGPGMTIQDLPECQADPALLRQVYLNLIGNAVKFTSRTSRPVIEVGALHGTTPAVYFVRDNGAGFDMRYYDRLFGVFQRLHREDEFEGTGVGLAIVKRIVQRHGGKVWAESVPGEGATFFFTLEGGKIDA